MWTAPGKRQFGTKTYAGPGHPETVGTHVKQQVQHVEAQATEGGGVRSEVTVWNVPVGQGHIHLDAGHRSVAVLKVASLRQKGNERRE
ncbi:hypothetical protein [Streptomyces sp. CA2R101]|uniref:hypothetical protein n=1 Tax=Streptomyces sp. CA2R101 TaxID=3120152 RepID=UPI003007FCCE